MSQALDQLCAAYGILPQYHDIWGKPHPTAPATQRALLAAMGVAASSEAEITQALQEVAQRPWRRMLPPVQVVRENAQPHRILLSVSRQQEGQTFQWCLHRESGEEIRGTLIPAMLAEGERAQLDGSEYVQRVFELNAAIEPGYHRLIISGPTTAEMSFIVAPASCYIPPVLQSGGRAWGFAAQLYGVRSATNWGMGDFGDLRRIIEYCGGAGAGVVLLNPLHALFPHAPEHASPYSPSNRAFFNVLYLDVEGIADFAECAAARNEVQTAQFQSRLAALRKAEQVDYRGVAQAKAPILERLYEHFCRQHLQQNTARAQAFRDFQAERGASLRQQALFETLQEYFYRQDNNLWGWPVWPPAYRDHQSAEVAQFCKTHLSRVEYFEYLQWQAAQQLVAAGKRSWELGLSVGMMLDLAIGVAEGGAATWMRPNLYAFGASTGAPPDEINRLGQDWGLPPMIPHRLREYAYEPFIELLRANMRDAGALRLDHVMGLYRLFWVARGLPVAEGAYVKYPVDDLLGILALESQRNRCLVVGEDLGTVPDEVRHALQAQQVYSTRLLYFEREASRFKSPGEYPEAALAAVTTHDLPTLAGYWPGLDVALRQELKLYPDEEMHQQQAASRIQEREQILLALREQGLLPADVDIAALLAQPQMTPQLAAAIYAYLGRTPSKLLLVQLEDGFGVLEQPNLPGTVEPTYPCWRLKMPVNLEDWNKAQYLQTITGALRRERPTA